jgi:hypothetical protein
VRTVTVGPPATIRERGHTIVSATVSIANERHDLWYRLPQGSAPADASAFLAAALLPAMQEGDRLEVAGEVSPRLLGAASTIQDIYHAWNPHWRRIPIHARGREAGPPRSERGGACFFTGGVDSFYTVFKHREAITALIFVHGFDVPLTNHALRETVSTAMKRVASALQQPLFEVETNLRQFADRYVSWDYYHGAALASVALLLSPQWSRIYVASTRSYATLIPMGSHPLLDPLWSTEHTEVVHDGCEAARVDKVAALAGCDLVLNTLRVCWENPAGAYNCGRCEKCLRTMIDLRIAGALDRCTTFARPLDLGAVSRMVVDRKAGYLEESLAAIERRGTDPALANALRTALARRRRRGALWSFGRAGRRLRGVLGSCKRLALPVVSRILATRGTR